MKKGDLIIDKEMSQFHGVVVLAQVLEVYPDGIALGALKYPMKHTVSKRVEAVIACLNGNE